MSERTNGMFCHYFYPYTWVSLHKLHESTGYKKRLGKSLPIEGCVWAQVNASESYQSIHQSINLTCTPP
jgi:hypothetical protein